MEDMNKLKEMLKKELAQYARRGELSAGSIDAIHKLTDTIKNLDKIEMLEEYGESDESHEGESYKRGRHYVKGHYSYGGESYRGGSYNDNSYEGGKEHMIHKLREMMEEADTEKEREAFRKCIDQLSRD